MDRFWDPTTGLPYTTPVLQNKIWNFNEADGSKQLDAGYITMAVVKKAMSAQFGCEAFPGAVIEDMKTGGNDDSGAVYLEKFFFMVCY